MTKRLANAVATYFPAVQQARNLSRCSGEFIELQAAWIEAQKLDADCKGDSG